MVKYSSPKIDEKRQAKKVGLSRHLLKVFLISFSIALILQIIILILIAASGQYIKTPARFGIGFGSFQIFRHVGIAYQFGSGLLFIAFFIATINVFLHWLRKHSRR